MSNKPSGARMIELPSQALMNAQDYPQQIVEVGDCVSRKGKGGCLMTVTTLSGSRNVGCTWFDDDGEFRTANFSANELVAWVFKPSNDILQIEMEQ